MSDEKMKSSQYVKLNVGGRQFQTTIATVSSKDNMLRTMFTGSMESHADAEGWILIDRCGKHFDTILNYLRDGSVALPDKERDIAELLAEAKYYLIEDLVLLCEQALDNMEKVPEQICKMQLNISAEDEELLLIMTSSKPVVRLTIKISSFDEYYHYQSDCIFLNIGLFEKYSEKYAQKGHFLRNDECTANDICRWSFYRNGRILNTFNCIYKNYVWNSPHLDSRMQVKFPETEIDAIISELFLNDNK